MSDEKKEPGLLERMVHLDTLRTVWLEATTERDEMAAAVKYIEALEAECRRVGVMFKAEK